MIEIHTISVQLSYAAHYDILQLDAESNFSHSRSIPSICAIPTTATTLPLPPCLRSIIAMCTSLLVIMTLYTGGKLRWSYNATCCALSLVFIDSTNCFGSILPLSSCPNTTRSSSGGNMFDICDGLDMIPVNEVDTALFISVIV